MREIALTRRINGSCLDEKLRLSGGNLALTCRRYNTYLEETWRSAAAHRKAQPKEDIPQMFKDKQKLRKLIFGRTVMAPCRVNGVVTKET